MCAIAGVMHLPIHEQIEQCMLHTMAHRGPDVSGSYEKEGKIILHTGPKAFAALDWGQQRYVMVWDGALYNALELREELEDLGHCFRGYSHAEIMLHGYAQWGKAITEKANAVFAMAVLEEVGGRVFLARDPIGVKPLFYTQVGMGLVFGSEIKTLLAHPMVKPELDADGAGELLLLGPGRTPGSGVFRGIREVEPGYRGYYESGKLQLEQYWKLRDRVHTESFEETAEHVRWLLTDAIHRQMTTDKALGCFLSGGLDSSIISAVCAKELGCLDTFSLDYLDNDKYFQPGKFQPNSDPEYIRAMQEHLGTNHHWTVLTPEELVNAMERATIARDLPGMADVDSSLLLFCSKIKEKVDVALSGECADEIFGGYPWYRDPAVRDTDGFPWAQNTRQRAAFLHSRYRLEPEAFVRQQYQQTLTESDILPDNPPLEKRMKQLVNLNFRWFMQTLIDRNDRMSMQSNLEVRVPYCDYRIAEYLYSVPWEYKDHGGIEKGLLRKAMEGLLPDKVMYRKKSPFPKTHHPEFSKLVAQQLRMLLQDKTAPVFEIVDRKAAENLMQQDYPWPWYGQLMRQSQTMVYLLQLNFWLMHYKVNIL